MAVFLTIRKRGPSDSVACPVTQLRFRAGPWASGCARILRWPHCPSCLTAGEWVALEGRWQCFLFIQSHRGDESLGSEGEHTGSILTLPTVSALLAVLLPSSLP